MLSTDLKAEAEKFGKTLEDSARSERVRIADAIAARGVEYCEAIRGLQKSLDQGDERIPFGAARLTRDQAKLTLSNLRSAYSGLIDAHCIAMDLK